MPTSVSRSRYSTCHARVLDQVRGRDVDRHAYRESLSCRRELARCIAPSAHGIRVSAAVSSAGDQGGQAEHDGTGRPRRVEQPALDVGVRRLLEQETDVTDAERGDADRDQPP